MKYQISAAVVTAFLTSTVAAAPDCVRAGFRNVPRTSTLTQIKYSCLGNNGRSFSGCDASVVQSMNSCISSSSCSDADKTGTSTLCMSSNPESCLLIIRSPTAAYQIIAQTCANAGASVTAAPEATFSATSGGSNWPSSVSNWGPYASGYSNAGNWQAWASANDPNYNGRGSHSGASSTVTTTDASGRTLTTITMAPSPYSGYGGGWHGDNSHGPFGGNNWGPWGSSGAWTSGPWTSWWGANGTVSGQCPGSTWSGWTTGSWSQTAPWTNWRGCTCSTTATATVTSTVSGSVTTSLSFGIRVAEATSGASASGSSASATRTGTAAAASATQASGAASVRTAAFGTLAAAFVGAVLLL